MEARNERGTIVFLLGRNITSPEDLAFLRNVLAETPCRSLADCKKPIPPSEEPHWESGTELTLAYPQVVALKGLETYLGRKDRDPALSPDALKLLREARGSSVVTVSRLAEEILAKYGG
jgi:hypothetical protein